jgi:hypothetical protein
MIGEPKAAKQTWAQERIALLTTYVRLVCELQKEMEPSPGVLVLRSDAIAQRTAWLQRERLEVRRAVREIGVSFQSDDELADELQATSTAIREWHRADEEAARRCSALKRFLDEARRLEGLERTRQILEQRGEGPAQRLAYGPAPTLAEVAADVYEIRDSLCQEQPDVERFLREVGQSLGSWSLAGGSLGILDFVAEQVNRAIGAYRRWPASKAVQRKAGHLADPIELARKVFSEFQQTYAEYLGRSGDWWLPYEGDNEDLGLTAVEVQAGLHVLLEKGLVKPRGMDGWQLTDKGREACLHPDSLGSKLGIPDLSSPVVHSSTVNVHGGHVQVGNNNTLIVSYQRLLREAADSVANEPTLPNDKRETLAEALRELSVMPNIEDLMAAAARASEVK